MSYFEVRGKKEELRFEALSQDVAEAFASSVFRDEKIVCGIFEVERAPRDHRKGVRS